MDNSEKLERARKKVAAIKSFRSHFVIYIIVNLFLAAINLLLTSGVWWFYWPLMGWGIGLVLHWYTVFGSDKLWGKDWENRKIKEFMDKENF